MKSEIIAILGEPTLERYVICDSRNTLPISSNLTLLDMIAVLRASDVLKIITNLPEAFLTSIINSDLNEVFDDIVYITSSKPEQEVWLNFNGITLDFNSPSNYVTDNENLLHDVFCRYYDLHIQLTEYFSSTGSEAYYQHEASTYCINDAIRLYPQGEVQDTLVFCQRFYGLHYPSILTEVKLPKGEPIQDPAMLRLLRGDITCLERISMPLICKVVLNASIPVLEVPKGHSCWLSISQLKALIKGYGDASFEIMDLWVFKQHEQFKCEMTKEKMNWLSVSLGFVTSNLVHQSSKQNWQWLYLSCEEKAFWLNLIHDMTSKFDVTVKAYGEGALSFYCWQGELDLICNYIRKRSAVLKHWDKDIQDNIFDMVNDAGLDFYDENIANSAVGLGAL